MPSPGQALAAMAGDPQSTYRVFTVDALGSVPGTVVVSLDGGQTTTVVSQLASYQPTVRDQVFAVRVDDGWLVLGKIGAPIVPISTDDVQTIVTNQMAGAEVPGVTPVPDPVTIHPDAQQGYRIGQSQTDDHVKAGSTNTLGNWYGGWFYGTKIADACAGKTVKSMTLTLARLNTAHGYYSAVPVHLGLHARATVGNPSIVQRWTPGLKLPQGGSGTVAIPADRRSALASGAARGFGAWGSDLADYLIYTLAEDSACGDVRIVFA